METTLDQPRISTVMVEIKVIKIGNSKMTLSVFDQLYEDECYDSKTSKILYPVWGKVNRKDHGEYVIFLADNELRKMKIPRQARYETFEDCVQYSVDKLRGSNVDYRPRGYLLQTIKVLYEEKKEAISKEQSKIWHEAVDNRIPMEHSKSYELAFLKTLTSDELDAVQDEYNRDFNATKQYNKMIGTLLQSNQLFIAV